MNQPEKVHINVAPTNPGQFFACCGLLELAQRIWPEAHGAFSPSGTAFSVTCGDPGRTIEMEQLLSSIATCAITSTMSEEQTARLKKLKNLNKKLRTAQIVAEMQDLDELWERERICLNAPFNIWLDWWSDERAGGSRFKTWAGKQFIIDIVRGMQAALRTESWRMLPPTQWLTQTADEGALPLYFDADIGGQSSSIDVGFSLDALDMRGRTRPMIELATFVGLQRFRPSPESDPDCFAYTTWTQPLPPVLAAAACCGQIPQSNARKFAFMLLYRTKYLKGFLPAKPKGD